MKINKRIISIIISFVVMFNIFSIDNIYAVPQTSGIANNSYYRIKNVASGLYLTMNSSSNTNGVQCSLQERMNSTRQDFKIIYHAGNFAYYITPRSSSSGKVLSITGNSANGSLITLQDYTGSTKNHWSIADSRTNLGYVITNLSGDKVLGTNNKNQNLGASIVLWDWTGGYCDWVIEPSFSGNAAYYCITELSDEDSAVADNVVTYLTNMGYNAQRVNYPPYGQIYVSMSSNTVTIFHGHGGDSGYMRLDYENGNSIRFYSENETSHPGFDYFKPYNLNRNQYIFFAVCYSGLNTEVRKSLARAAWENCGAACATGFRNSVSGGEDYINYILFYLNYATHDGGTLYDALSYASSRYSIEKKKNEDCPANPNNVITYGRTNKTIKLT